MTSRSATAGLPPLAFNAWLRYDVVQRLLPPDVRDVLEVGCGQGSLGARLSRRYGYLGVELDPVSYEVAAARVAAAGGTGEVRQGDLSLLDPAERFDLVCAFEVLEHIEDDRAALADWVDRLRPGGWVLLSTPAYQHRFGPADEMAGHFRRYDPAVMAERLRAAGLVDVEVVLYGMPLGYLLEAARNAVGRRRQARTEETGIAERTSGSGRLLQPNSRRAGLVTQLGTAPFRRIQRFFPGRGPGLVARGRLPA
jgi:SAM-dependent methyltransferase